MFNIWEWVFLYCLFSIIRKLKLLFIMEVNMIFEWSMVLIDCMNLLFCCGVKFLYKIWILYYKMKLIFRGVLCNGF